LDNVQYSPARGRYKVYLIDEVHMLSKSSFNALLKTLEEPPPHVKFLLATTDPQKLPATVLSRCLQFSLKRLSPKLIRERLHEICQAEDVTAEEAALVLLARAADGSLRDALSLLDQAIAFGSGTLTEPDVAAMLGTIDHRHVTHLLEILAAEDAAGLMQSIAEIDEQFPDYARLLEELARTLQRVAVYQAVGATDLGDDYAEGEIANLAELISAADAQLFYQIALMGRRDLGLAPDPRSGAEMTLLRMLAFKPSQAPSGGAPQNSNSRPAAVRKPAIAKERPAAKRTAGPSGPAASSKSAVKTTEEWQDPDWTHLIDELDISGGNRLLAGNCAYLRREGNLLKLALDARSESLLTRSRSDAIAAALSKYFGETLHVEIKVGKPAKETPLQKEVRLGDEKLEQARESLEADPNVKALKDMFGAELNPESVEPLN
jgi:DNA polymerase-3 subunit gamma/tau